MAQNHDAGVDRQDPFRDSIGDLAAAIEERPPLTIQEVPQARSGRHLYWVIGGLCAAVIGVAEVGIVMHGTAPNAPAAPAAMLAAVEKDPCAARMQAIMGAIAAYTTAHGSPPPSLTALTPEYLSFAPIDPASNQPYGYQVVGESITLSCPSVEQNPPSPLQPAAGRAHDA